MSPNAFVVDGNTQHWPANAYHLTKGHRLVKDEDEMKELAQEGWSLRYIHQQFPKTVYHQTEGTRLVKNQAEWDKLGKGWQAKPFPDVEPEPEADPVEQMQLENEELKARLANLEKLMAVKK